MTMNMAQYMADGKKDDLYEDHCGNHVVTQYLRDHRLTSEVTTTVNRGE